MQWPVNPPGFVTSSTLTFEITLVVGREAMAGHGQAVGASGLGIREQCFSDLSLKD